MHLIENMIVRKPILLLTGDFLYMQQGRDQKTYKIDNSAISQIRSFGGNPLH